MSVAAVAGSQSLWFVSRGSGLVLLVLFSVVMMLGAATRTGSAPRRWPRFAVAELHRTLSLFAVALLGLHVVTAILDPYVTIGWAATAVPFASPYRTLAIGLGTLAVDLAGAVLLTSLARRWLGFRAWRAVHWLAYLAWPVAFIHSLRAGNDLGVWWAALIEWGSAALVATAVLARLFGRFRAGPAQARPRRPGPLRRDPHDEERAACQRGCRRQAAAVRPGRPAVRPAPPAARPVRGRTCHPRRACHPAWPAAVVRNGSAAP